jgi:hypothetical protein
MPVAYKKGALIDSYQRRVIDTWIVPLTGMDTLTVTRGHSLAIDQLHTLAELAADNGVVFPEFNPADVYARVNISYDGKTLEAYAWWQTWVECLRRGIVVNPPLAAVISFAFGTHAAGDIIQASPHIVLLAEDPHLKTCPIDWSQRINRGTAGEYIDIEHVADIISQAKLNGAPINQIKVELKNGCVHMGLDREKHNENT